MSLEFAMKASGVTAGAAALPPTARDRFVGGLGITVPALAGPVAPDNGDIWFQGADVRYVGAARTAIRKAFSLLGLRPGDEVLVPSYHCGSEIDALLHAGAVVRLFRVSSAAQIDFDDLCRRITPATRAVYIIHYFGFAQDLTLVADLCRTRGLRLIEDCALGSFTRIQSRRIGSVGDVAVYNFPKMLPMPDGGALVVNNPELRLDDWRMDSPPVFSMLLEMARLAKPSVLRRLPFSAARALFRRSGEPLHPGAARPEMPASYYFDARMENRGLSLVSGRILKRTNLSEVRARRRQNFSLLSQLLAAEPGVTLLFKSLPDGVCPLCFPVIVPRARDIARHLRAASIPAIAWWAGYHRAEFDWNEFSEARHLKDNLLALPVHHQLDEAAVRFIAGRFLLIHRGA